MPPNGTAADQHRIIEDLVARGVAGIALSPNDAANQTLVLNEIIPERVTFITQDSDLLESSRRKYYIGTNNIEAGRTVGYLVKQACAAAFPLETEIKLVIYVGKLDVQNARERRQGVISALADEASDQAGEALAGQPYPIRCKGKDGRIYSVLDTRTDDVSTAKCKANVEDTLAKHPDVKCLVGLWAYNPPAMLEAVKAAGKGGRIQLVGFDEDEQTLLGIREGLIHATVVQDPYEFGRQAVRTLAYQIRDGKLPESPRFVDQRYFVPHRIVKRGIQDQTREFGVTVREVEAFHKDLREKKG
jgi:ribose transport system substrate-binding protein